MGTAVFFSDSNIHTVLTFQIFSTSKFNREMFLFLPNKHLLRSPLRIKETQQVIPISSQVVPWGWLQPLGSFQRPCPQSSASHTGRDRKYSLRVTRIQGRSHPTESRPTHWCGA